MGQQLWLHPHIHMVVTARVADAESAQWWGCSE
ncbi:MAG TPA: hypothetical protein DCR55_11185 [Lentisphaeria bacterium]|nr:hypothetical protein [Lentisphaeria bacterium]